MIAQTGKARQRAPMLEVQPSARTRLVLLWPIGVVVLGQLAVRWFAPAFGNGAGC